MILRGDCIEVMKAMKPNSIDAIVTDPPYGIGFDYSGNREPHNSPKDYWHWLFPIYEHMMSLLKPGGFFAIWQAALYFRHFWDWYGDNIHIYASCKNFVQLRKTPINYGFDPVVMKYKDGAKPLRPGKPKRSIDYFVANTAGIISDISRPEKSHPCPRPLDAVIEIIDNFTLPGGIILDPFLGSGTTMIAANKCGRKCIGIEKEPEYIEIAKRRTKNFIKG